MLSNHISQRRTENDFNNLCVEIKTNILPDVSGSYMWGYGEATFEFTGIEKYLHQRSDYRRILC